MARFRRDLAKVIRSEFLVAWKIVLSRETASYTILRMTNRYSRTFKRNAKILRLFKAPKTVGMAFYFEDDIEVSAFTASVQNILTPVNM